MSAFEAGKKLLCGSYTQFTVSGKSNFVRAGRWGKVPQRGAIPYFYSNSLDRVAHVGGVIDIKVHGDTYTIKTVEGNTSADNSFNRNGGCVAVKEYTFNLSQVGGKNRINGFGYPVFGSDTCTVDEFIEVLKSEVGYIEKASNHNLDDKKANPGDANFTKYGDWYGSNGVYWCQQFISWCVYAACDAHRASLETGWIEVQGRWKYRKNGQYIKAQWQYIDGRWYVFDEEGYTITGWFKQGSEWYYLNPDDAAMLSGQWLRLDGKDYYLTKTGIMASNCYIKSDKTYHWIDNNGEYVPEYDTDNPNLDVYKVAE